MLRVRLFHGIATPVTCRLGVLIFTAKGSFAMGLYFQGQPNNLHPVPVCLDPDFKQLGRAVPIGVLIVPSPLH